MNRDELISHLGTIARSGSAQFVQALEEGKDGQGKDGKSERRLANRPVWRRLLCRLHGFADKVTVVSRKAGEDASLAVGQRRPGRVRNRRGASEQVAAPISSCISRRMPRSSWRRRAISAIITKYSDHIALPITAHRGRQERKDQPGRRAVDPLQVRDQRRAIPRFLPPRRARLRRAVGHACISRAEGKIEYTGLVFIPATKPFDLFHPDRKQSLKLYVKRVFITDHCEGSAAASWLRFVKGLVDSEDLPLNISREMLQQNPVLDQDPPGRGQAGAGLPEEARRE